MNALPESDKLSPTTVTDVIGAALASPGRNDSTNAHATSLFRILTPLRSHLSIKAADYHDRGPVER
jgi:hypothetical protein